MLNDESIILIGLILLGVIVLSTIVFGVVYFLREPKKVIDRSEEQVISTRLTSTACTPMIESDTGSSVSTEYLSADINSEFFENMHESRGY